MMQRGLAIEDRGGVLCKGAFFPAQLQLPSLPYGLQYVGGPQRSYAARPGLHSMHSIASTSPGNHSGGRGMIASAMTEPASESNCACRAWLQSSQGSSKCSHSGRTSLGSSCTAVGQQEVLALANELCSAQRPVNARCPERLTACQLYYTNHKLGRAGDAFGD